MGEGDSREPVRSLRESRTSTWTRPVSAVLFPQRLGSWGRRDHRNAQWLVHLCCVTRRWYQGTTGRALDTPAPQAALSVLPDSPGPGCHMCWVLSQAVLL